MAQPVWQQAFSKEDFLALKKNSAIWIWQKQEEWNWKNNSIRYTYQEKLIKANIIPDRTTLHLAETAWYDYGVPW